MTPSPSGKETRPDDMPIGKSEDDQDDSDTSCLAATNCPVDAVPSAPLWRYSDSRIDWEQFCCTVEELSQPPHTSATEPETILLSPCESERETDDPFDPWTVLNSDKPDNRHILFLLGLNPFHWLLGTSNLIYDESVEAVGLEQIVEFEALRIVLDDLDRFGLLQPPLANHARLIHEAVERITSLEYIATLCSLDSPTAPHDWKERMQGHAEWTVDICVQKLLLNAVERIKAQRGGDPEWIRARWAELEQAVTQAYDPPRRERYGYTSGDQSTSGYATAEDLASDEDGQESQILRRRQAEGATCRPGWRIEGKRSSSTSSDAAVVTTAIKAATKPPPPPPDFSPSKTRKSPRRPFRRPRSDTNGTAAISDSDEFDTDPGLRELFCRLETEEVVAGPRQQSLGKAVPAPSTLTSPIAERRKAKRTLSFVKGQAKAGATRPPPADRNDMGPPYLSASRARGAAPPASTSQQRQGQPPASSRRTRPHQQPLASKPNPNLYRPNSHVDIAPIQRETATRSIELRPATQSFSARAVPASYHPAPPWMQDHPHSHASNPARRDRAPSVVDLTLIDDDDDDDSTVPTRPKREHSTTKRHTYDRIGPVRQYDPVRRTANSPRDENHEAVLPSSTTRTCVQPGGTASVYATSSWSTSQRTGNQHRRTTYSHISRTGQHQTSGYHLDPAVQGQKRARPDRFRPDTSAARYQDLHDPYAASPLHWQSTWYPRSYPTQ